ncbi:protein PET100 homolog, mitochondrial-like [Anneissia japonica]|uniref:protein PET100 homolog, mitochondrial-like n=1 Tax=Anneissia japonica TaxID=1529436 RepID=UPI0014258574|nr:protein PET100 homolog, mitochondrial-like [Anneissia japonica]
MLLIRCPLEMGGWRLESAKMVIYIFFPVATFYYFNQTEYFEEKVSRKIRQLYPPECKMQRKELEAMKNKIQNKHYEKMREEEENYLKNKDRSAVTSS